jgi:serine/threonine-protein kinase HipA
MSMAMSLKGKNRHYRWESMFERHWFSTAKLCNFPEESMAQIIEQILGGMDHVIEDVGNKLPKGFPDDVSTPIFDGMRQARDRMS